VTIAVRIENADDRRTIVVLVERVMTPLKPAHTGRLAELKPGTSGTFHVHAAQSLRIVEDPDAQA